MKLQLTEDIKFLFKGFDTKASYNRNKLTYFKTVFKHQLEMEINTKDYKTIIVYNRVGYLWFKKFVLSHIAINSLDLYGNTAALYDHTNKKFTAFTYEDQQPIPIEYKTNEQESIFELSLTDKYELYDMCLVYIENFNTINRK